MILKRLIKTALVVASLAGVQAAQAALVSCPSSFIVNPTAKVENPAGNMTAVSACQYLNNADNNNSASLININNANFFGTSTWAVNGSNLEVQTPNQSSGSWSITGANFAAFDYMIVFKNGQDTNLVGFLFNEMFSNGVWSTPFTTDIFTFQNGNAAAHDVSHYTIVQRAGGITTPGGGEVPEPGILALMGLGMASFVAARRRSLR